MVADIPGLIEGAHTGSGLGTQFLRHIERTRLLVHLVDVSDASGRPDPVKDVEVINGELESFGAGLDKKPMIMAASKIDVANKEKLAKLKRYCKKKELELFPISAVTGKGIEELKYTIAEKLDEIRDEEASRQSSRYRELTTSLRQLVLYTDSAPHRAPCRKALPCFSRYNPKSKSAFPRAFRADGT